MSTHRITPRSAARYSAASSWPAVADEIEESAWGSPTEWGGRNFFGRSGASDGLEGHSMDA